MGGSAEAFVASTNAARIPIGTEMDRRVIAERPPFVRGCVAQKFSDVCQWPKRLPDGTRHELAQ